MSGSEPLKHLLELPSGCSQELELLLQLLALDRGAQLVVFCSPTGDPHRKAAHCLEGDGHRI